MYMHLLDDRDDKSSVFEEVLRPRFRPDSNKRKAIQVEIHVFLSPKEIKASILLNKLRLIGIFDLIMELKSFVFDKIPENDGEEEGEWVHVDEYVFIADSYMGIFFFFPYIIITHSVVPRI